MSDLIPLASILAAITAVCVAAWQGWLMKETLKHALYERRFAVYSSVMQYLSKICTCPTLEFADNQTLLKETREAEFLFHADIEQLIHRFVQQGSQLRMLRTRLIRSSGLPGENALRDELISMENWFATEAIEEVKRDFRPYLKLYGGEFLEAAKRWQEKLDALEESMEMERRA